MIMPTTAARAPSADPRYPIGRFTRPSALTPAERSQAIAVIEQCPAAMAAAIKGLNDAQLDTTYRDGGWTLRQVVHHVADSHMNAYTRFKLALTENIPTIKPYDEAKWAELADGRSPLVQESIALLTGLHARWVYLLRHMQPSDFARQLTHPEWQGPMSLDQVLALYWWHSRHHVAHITSTRQRHGW
jgi:hypothetical protein